MRARLQHRAPRPPRAGTGSRLIHTARIRRPPGGGHFLLGLSPAQTLVVLIGVVVIVLAIYYTRRR
ncbi:hypothetical protein GCM10023349_36940 [Nocardioides conyzicola]|uniref:LPXTG cell wall anchor domain-containing protein n=1 Tax=Nocardioides conyzicola TaxID=1651781 RepID=A0ABP8XWG8_9ACTN